MSVENCFLHSSVPGKSARTMKCNIDKSRSINTMPASTFFRTYVA